MLLIVSPTQLMTWISRWWDGYPKKFRLENYFFIPILYGFQFFWNWIRISFSIPKIKLKLFQELICSDSVAISTTCASSKPSIHDSTDIPRTFGNGIWGKKIKDIGDVFNIEPVRFFGVQNSCKVSIYSIKILRSLLKSWCIIN